MPPLEPDLWPSGHRPAFLSTLPLGEQLEGSGFQLWFWPQVVTAWRGTVKRREISLDRVNVSITTCPQTPREVDPASLHLVLRSCTTRNP